MASHLPVNGRRNTKWTGLRASNLQKILLLSLRKTPGKQQRIKGAISNFTENYKSTNQEFSTVG